jgi:hypothetical protein
MTACGRSRLSQLAGAVVGSQPESPYSKSYCGRELCNPDIVYILQRINDETGRGHAGAFQAAVHAMDGFSTRHLSAMDLGYSRKVSGPYS